MSKKINTRCISLVLTLALMLSSIFSINAFAAGIEDLKPGYNDIGSFTFTDTNTTPVKTVLGTHVDFGVTWRVADGYYGIPNIDKGIGEVKLTLKILDANTGAVLAGPITHIRQPEEDTWFLSTVISANVYYGQKVRVWFDASSVGPSNGNFRSVHVRDFSAKVS